MKLNIKALTLTCAVLWSALVFLVGLVNLAFPSYGEVFLRVMESLYPGYHYGNGFASVMVGALYALLDGAIAGAVLGWLYNRLVPTTRG
ncbi:MAG TPA: hypothetical protein VGB22_00145 [candidate division Zixibacteria bacterium]|jgi:ABC-type nitrate/sulfonate/bicarbonate transport system permease component